MCKWFSKWTEINVGQWYPIFEKCEIKKENWIKVKIKNLRNNFLHTEKAKYSLKKAKKEKLDKNLRRPENRET